MLISGVMMVVVWVIDNEWFEFVFESFIVVVIKYENGIVLRIL